MNVVLRKKQIVNKQNKKFACKTKKYGVRKKSKVSVAQLDRVSASDAEGCGFKPRRIRQ